jgi:hypothetical protein
VTIDATTADRLRNEMAEAAKIRQADKK